MQIVANKVNFTYNKKSAFGKQALIDIDLDVASGQMVAIVGHTGSGKTTFVQHLNALIRLQDGQLKVGEYDLADKKVDLKKLRADVGMVFQYPEYQLFADTVELDVAFGPKNLGIEQDKIPQLVKEALTLVGMDYDAVKNKSPFDLSGGEKRRVALAGVLACKPKVLVLDEPTAGLDPQGKGEILSLVRNLNTQEGITVIMVSHDMNEVYENCDRIILFGEGKVVYDLPTEQLFAMESQVEQHNLAVPVVAQFVNSLANRGIVLPGRVRTVQDAVTALVKVMGVQDNA